MRNKRFVMLLFFALLYVYTGSTGVFAMNTGFSMQTMKTEDQNTFLSNIQLVKNEKEPKKNSIECFDVNEDGLIAIGTSVSSDSSRKVVSVYDLSGDYKYGFDFNCHQSFGVEWDGNNLLIYFVRSDVAALVDEKGTILKLQEIENTTNNNSYWNHSVFSTQRTVGNYKYIIKNDMGLLNIFASSYSQLIAVDDQGNQKILYDVNNAQMARTIIMFIAVIMIVALAVSVIVSQFLKMRRTGDDSKPLKK